jgi:demethylmenaquinone methyltransferase/2-methoxy-6-polyprenyl-1,4-benzoquinol methylase
MTAKPPTPDRVEATATGPLAPLALTRDQIIADYDRIAPRINFGYALMFPHRVRFMRQHVLPRLAIEAGQTVLDLCCGAGHNLPLLAAAVGPRGRVIGVDFSSGMLAKARDRVATAGLTQVTLIEGDAYALPEILAQPVDRVLCSFGLGLMTDPVAFVRAARSVMRPGARIALIDQLPFAGLLRVLNPLLYVAMSPIPVNNVAIFQLAQRGLAALPTVFPGADVQRHHAGTVFVAVGACAPAGSVSPLDAQAIAARAIDP